MLSFSALQSLRGRLLQKRNKEKIITRIRKEAPLMKASTTITLLWSVLRSGMLMTTLPVTLSKTATVEPVSPDRSGMARKLLAVESDMI